MSTNWIWNIDSEKDRKNEKEGDRLAKLNEKKSARELGWEPGGGGGGYFRDFYVGMCRWDPGTLNLYQS